MVTVVTGGFYGDEGKGKVVGYLAWKDKPEIVVRAGGGPQAGHTVTDGVKVTQVPSGLVSPTSRLLIGRGTVINPQVVLKEIEENNVGQRIGIDYGCTIITSEHIDKENELVSRIGSVGTGTGPARVDRVLRSAKLAKDASELAPYLVDVAEEVNAAIDSHKNVLIEGVQGFGLSLLDHNYYPYVTSQDTTASQFLADTGIGPKAVDEVVTAFKVYISRVGKGPLATEWDEGEVKRYGIAEFGSVSGRQRRLGDFDKEMARDAIRRNTATMGAVTCIDRLFPGNEGKTSFDDLTPDAKAFFQNLEESLKNTSPYFKGFKFISTGSKLEEVIDLR